MFLYLQSAGYIQVHGACCKVNCSQMQRDIKYRRQTVSQSEGTGTEEGEVAHRANCGLITYITCSQQRPPKDVSAGVKVLYK